MGRGQIIAHKGDGLYDVRLIYAYRSRVTERLATYTAQMADLDTKIAAETDPNKLALLKLQRASIQKLYDYYTTNMPADPTVEAWCADLTEDLTGNVGTIEIPGEQVTVIVRPGYNNRAVYTSARDGQMMPAIAGSPNQVLFNWMLLPGWQRHKPVYRVGTVAAINHETNTCTVCLESAYSSQQYLPAVDGLTVGDCNTGSPFASQVTDFCSRYPDHPFCTNTDEGSEINLTDGQLAQLKAVNLYVNQNYDRQSDPSGLRLGDSWDVMSPGGAGDCEDFAVTKMQKLVDDYGWNPANLKIVSSFTKDGGGHAFLAVRTTNRGLVALDVNSDNVIESGKLPYRVDKVAMTKDSWKSYTRKMESVAVEYMTCNSWAFVPGDRVVVEFTSQDWTQPKVVGFAEAPEACGATIWRHGVVYYDGTPGTGAWKYTTATNTWEWGGWTANQFPAGLSTTYQLGSNSISFDLAGHQWIFGGGRSFNYCPNYLQHCQRYDTTLLSFSVRADHPDPARQSGASAWFIGAGSYLVAGARVLFCYPDYDPENPEDPGVPDSAATVQNDSDFFNDTLNTWASKQSLPYSMWMGIDFAIGGFGYIGGGDNYGGATGVTFDNLYRYDPAGDAWAARADLLRNLFVAQGASVDGNGYCLLGYCTTSRAGDNPAAADDRSFYNTQWLDEYDPVTDAWTIKSAGIGWNNLAGAVGAISKVWSECEVGTEVDDPDIQEYTPATDSWAGHASAGWSSVANSRLAL